MATNYFDATGVLSLEQVTPIIHALFGCFDVDDAWPGNGAAYITWSTDSGGPQWNEVLLGLIDLAARLDLPSSDDEPTVKSVLVLLAAHFGAAQDAELMRLIEQHVFEDAVDLATLFFIAVRFNDGHNLVALSYEGCWHSSKARLFEYGGDGGFLSREFCMSTSSAQARDLGPQIREAILMNDVEEVAVRIARETLALLSGIGDLRVRASVHRRVIERLHLDAAYAVV